MKLIQRVALAIGDRQAGLNLLWIGHEEAMFGVAHQCRGEACLLLDHIISVEQARQKLVHGAVTQTLVERALTRVDHIGAGAIVHGVGQRGGIAAEFTGLQLGGAHFRVNGKTQGNEGNDQQEPEQPPP
ncbi:hypothetical protein D3C75_1102210 [compost metagenome]